MHPRSSSGGAIQVPQLQLQLQQDVHKENLAKHKRQQMHSVRLFALSRLCDNTVNTIKLTNKSHLVWKNILCALMHRITVYITELQF